MIKINESFSIDTSAYNFSFARSSGPGGQNVNKVNSKAILSWQITASSDLPGGVKRRFYEAFASRINKDDELILHCESSRDQASNIEGCKQRLREMLIEVWTPPKPRIRTKPSKAAKQKRLDSKKKRSDTKQKRRKIDY